MIVFNEPLDIHHVPTHLSTIYKAQSPQTRFRSVNGALNTIAGYEAMNIIRKGEIRWVAKNDVVGQIRFIDRTCGIAA